MRRGAAAAEDVRQRIAGGRPKACAHTAKVGRTTKNQGGAARGGEASTSSVVPGAALRVRDETCSAWATGTGWPPAVAEGVAEAVTEAAPWSRGSAGARSSKRFSSGRTSPARPARPCSSAARGAACELLCVPFLACSVQTAGPKHNSPHSPLPFAREVLIRGAARASRAVCFRTHGPVPQAPQGRQTVDPNTDLPTKPRLGISFGRSSTHRRRRNCAVLVRAVAVDEHLPRWPCARPSHDARRAAALGGAAARRLAEAPRRERARDDDAPELQHALRRQACVGTP